MTRTGAVGLALFLASLPLGHADDRFRFPIASLVEDTARGLVWERCSLGQVFHEGRCRGEAARLTLAEAEARLGAMATAECPWRLPRFFELRGLVQAGDGNTAIEGEAFPDTPAGWYWTQVSAGGHSQQDCFVDFAGRGRTRCNMAGRFHVRPVMSLESAAPVCLSPGPGS